MPRRPPGLDAILVFACALLLFGTTATGFEARVTDISALRVLNGDVPYRDFWTMYAPGSFVTLAVAFALFGRQLIVSNLLGIVTSAVAVAMYYRLARAASDTRTAVLLAALVAVAFFGSGYHDGFTSYPAAFLLILTGVRRAARDIAGPRSSWAMIPGLLLGAAALFKHDVAGYAIIAAMAAIVVARRRAHTTPAWPPALLFGAAAGGVLLLTGGILFALGAGPDLWTDLVTFPLTDFRYVRVEYFPIVPHLQPTLTGTAREMSRWATFNLPLIALAVGWAGVWRRWRTLDATPAFLVAFASIVFAFHWWAAHVQMNTNAISLSAWGALVAAIGLHQTLSRRRLAAFAVLATVGFWAAGLVAEPAYTTAREMARGTEWVGTAHLRGIRASRLDASWMRDLEAAIAEAGNATAPLLFVSNRNDVNLFAESTPFWFSDRPPATRHHELHPGITDTEPVQTEMLAQLARDPFPVVVREHRFPDDVLDSVKAGWRQHVPVGSTLIDAWLSEHYETGPTFGMYEVMRLRSTVEKRD